MDCRKRSRSRFLALLSLAAAALVLPALLAPRPGSAQAAGKQFHVAPNGSPSGNGSAARPWSLAAALEHPGSVRPGDTIWLHGGTYRGTLTSKLAGSAGAPITVRQAPGERATIDGSLTINGQDTVYWGFEVMSSDPRRVTRQPGSDPKDIPRQGGAIQVRAPRTKLINLIVHDLGDGIGFWSQAPDSEIYGCLTYNNGWQGPDRGHGHGVYIQNQTGSKLIQDVISFNNFATGMKVYGEQGYAVGVTFEGVTAFNNGSLRDTSQPWELNLLVGTAVHPADRISLRSNYLYQPAHADAGNLRLGYTAKTNGSLTLTDNYIAGGTGGAVIYEWESIKASGNTFFARGKEGLLAQIRTPGSKGPSRYAWDNNQYFDALPAWKENRQVYSFQLDKARNSYGGGMLTFPEWQKSSGLDARSTYRVGRPTETRVFVRPNKYEPGRAHATVFNWKLAPKVKVDLAGAGLKMGASYKVVDAQNYFGAPVLQFTHTGAPIEVPMNLTTVAQPIGKVPSPPKHTAPEFGAFVIQPA